MGSDGEIITFKSLAKNLRHRGVAGDDDARLELVLHAYLRGELGDAIIRYNRSAAGRTPAHGTVVIAERGASPEPHDATQMEVAWSPTAFLEAVCHPAVGALMEVEQEFQQFARERSDPSDLATAPLDSYSPDFRAGYIEALCVTRETACRWLDAAPPGEMPPPAEAPVQRRDHAFTSLAADHPEPAGAIRVRNIKENVLCDWFKTVRWPQFNKKPYPSRDDDWTAAKRHFEGRFFVPKKLVEKVRKEKPSHWPRGRPEGGSKDAQAAEGPSGNSAE